MEYKVKNILIIGLVGMLVISLVASIYDWKEYNKVKRELIKCANERSYEDGLKDCAIQKCELELYSDICKRTVRINPDGSKTVTIDSKECPGAFKDQLLA